MIANAAPDIPVAWELNSPEDTILSKTIYVDAVTGNDNSSGTSADTSLRSLAAASALLDDGAQLMLHAGQSWAETLWVRAPDVAISSYGEGVNPLIDGGGARHGVVIQASGVSVNAVDVSHALNGVYVTGAAASATIHGGVYDGNGTGIVAGGGGALTLVDGSICKNSTLKLGAGDGIQVSEDASAGAHTFTNVCSSGNDKQGLNFKIGTANVSGSAFEYNGETGVLGQVNASLINLHSNKIGHNNTANNGTFNLGLENSVEIHSSVNTYADPTPGSLAYNNVNMSGATKFYSTGDTFLEGPALDINFGSSIRVHTEGAASVVEVRSPVMQINHQWGSFIDASGASGSEVSAFDADFTHLSDTPFRAPDGSTPVLYVGTTVTGAAKTIAATVDAAVTGGSSADILNGGSGDDTLDAKGGGDKLYGHDGNDFLMGGTGGDLLDGGAGLDTASYASAANSVAADLKNSSHNKGEASGDTYVSIENLMGSASADTLRGSDAVNTISGGAGNDSMFGYDGNDLLQGGDGNDILYGGLGSDSLYGGAGADRFVFQAAVESTSASVDVIYDFATGVDRIDMRGIDANLNVGRDQSFTSIGSVAFSGQAGQLQLVNGVLSGDINGDSVADFSIGVIGVSSLSAVDFYL